MFKRHEVKLISNPTCNREVTDLESSDFKYYDKDGFELNMAERKFYAAVNYPLINCLNHVCWQEPWFTLEDNKSGLILDHAMFLCRASYSDEALKQLHVLKEQIPTASYLIKTRSKWGYDFALDAVRDGETFEVIHVEYDNLDYERFANSFISFEYMVRHTDWSDAADRIWAQRDQWEVLTGFEQNNWKAKYLIGWSKAEYTEKSLKESK